MNLFYVPGHSGIWRKEGVEVLAKKVLPFCPAFDVNADNSEGNWSVRAFTAIPPPYTLHHAVTLAELVSIRIPISQSVMAHHKHLSISEYIQTFCLLLPSLDDHDSKAIVF
jgi:hypothetical protein